MPHEVPPKAGFISQLEHVTHRGAKRWRSHDGQRLYTWDTRHGELEVFNSRGRHLGAVDPTTGVQTKGAVKGRTIDDV